MMLMGMTERLQTGEERLQQAIDQAEQESKKLDDTTESEISVPG